MTGLESLVAALLGGLLTSAAPCVLADELCGEPRLGEQPLGDQACHHGLDDRRRIATPREALRQLLAREIPARQQRERRGADRS
mgnify:CR=1 FL=1